jgi:hypothetical protein
MILHAEGNGRAAAGRLILAAAVWIAAVACRCPTVRGAEPAADGNPAAGPEVVEFIRVRVPPGRLRDVPLGDERHVPLSAAEFDRALARLGPGAPRADRPRSLPEAARYQLRPDATGGLVGRVVIEVRDAAPGRFVILGAVRAEGGTVRSVRGEGGAVVFGMPGGGAALATPEPGTYACEIAVPPPDGAALHRLPLVGGLTTSIDLTIPAASRPLVSAAGRPLVRRIDAGETESLWRIDLGPEPTIDIEIVGRDRPAPRIAVWTRGLVRGAAVEIAAQFVPAGGWTDAELVLTKSPAVRPTAVRVVGGDDPVAWREAAEGSELRIAIPPGLESGSTPLVVEAVAPAEQGREWAVPALGVDAAAWGGGGIVLGVDPALVIEAVEAGTGCRVVTPEVAGRWPLPPVGPAGDFESAARLQFELQQHAGEPRVLVRPRSVQFDVARVTSVELTREQVVGRANCDVRVVSGEAFGIEGRIMKGWVIDSVEAVEWGAGQEQNPADRQRVPVAESRVLEWAGADLPARDGVRPLRIALDAAVTPARGIGLRITGHRLGVPFDGNFETGDMDMVRFDGESADTAVVDFRPAPEAIVEVGGLAVGGFEVAERLTPLVEETAPRGRIRGGARAASRTAVLVRRRPPIDATVAVDLAVRAETVTETFRIACRSTAASIDSFVVHFSEPMGDDLEWELVSPEGGGLVVRRVEAADATRVATRDRGAGESWLVELTPAVVGRVRVRAAREVPCTAVVPMPLAWVEAALQPGGTVLVRGEGASRPGVRNRRLRELPPGADAPAGTVAEFGYSEADRRSGPGPAHAEILPPSSDAEARAWAWHEESTVWCHDSGATEIESRFDVENHGRDAVTLTPLPGRRLREVLIDGRPLDLPNLAATGGSVRVPLPTDRQRLTLEIRALAEHATRLGAWWIGTTCCTLDMPLLDRRLRLLLPPELEAVTAGGRYREVGAAPRGWSERLFALPSGSRAARGGSSEDAPEGPVGEAGSLVVGFRARWFLPATGAADGVTIGIVRRRLLDAAATVSAWLAIVAVSVAMRRSRSAGIVIPASSALLALWLPVPFDTIARAAWWAGVGGVLAAAWGRRAFRSRMVVGIAAVVACGWAAPAGAADERGPLRVFVVPGADGDDVLVPERLFRLLAATAAEQNVGFRVIACRVRVAVAAVEDPWTVEMDVDADPGGRTVLDQRACGGRWIQPTDGDPASTVRLEAGGQVARLLASAGGRFTVRLPLRPAVERRGDVEFIEACLPAAARSAVELVDPQGRPLRPAEDALQCEAARHGGPYLKVGGAGTAGAAIDVSGAARVRLVRPADRRDRLATGGLRGVRILNEVSWELDACGLQATFDVDPGTSIARSFVVVTPPEMRLVARPAPASEPAFTVVPLGPGRQFVELLQPRRGPARVRLGFRSGLVAPVGRFTVPEARVEGALADMHEVRLTAAAGLDVEVEPPVAALTVAPAEGEPLRSGWSWRTDRAEGQPDTELRGRLSVRRRPQDVRATQRLEVEFGAEGETLQLRARLDASTTPLAAIPVEVPPGFSVARVEVYEDEVLGGGAADRGPLDISWQPPQAVGEMSIVVQRPRAGRFRLEVDADRPVPPKPRGTVPLLRTRFAGGAPLVVEWRQANGDADTGRHTAEVSGDGPGPDYELATAPLPSVEPPAVELPPTAVVAATGERQEGVLAARVHAALDPAGRLRGVARFDLLTGGGLVRLRLPGGMRLFDVLVDGREVQPVPEGPEAWVVRLHDPLWPRSVSVVFGADVGLRGPAGQVRLVAPTVDGLRGREVVWTIDPPPGATATIAAPARPLDEASWEAHVRGVEADVVKAFGAVIAATPEPMRDRYRDFAATLAAGPASPLEASWDDSLPRTGGAGGGRVHGLAAADGTISCRLQGVADETLPARVVLTVALAAAIGLARAAAVRRGRAKAAD